MKMKKMYRRKVTKYRLEKSSGSKVYDTHTPRVISLISVFISYPLIANQLILLSDHNVMWIISGVLAAFVGFICLMIYPLKKR